MPPSNPSHHRLREPTVPLSPRDGKDQGAQEYLRLQQGGWDPESESVATPTLDLEDIALPSSDPDRNIATLSPAAGSHLAPQSALISFGALGTSQGTV